MAGGAHTPHWGDWLCAMNAFWCCSCRLSRVTVIVPVLALPLLLALLGPGSGRKLCCEGFAGSFGANAMRSFVYWFSYEYSPGLHI